VWECKEKEKPFHSIPGGKGEKRSEEKGKGCKTKKQTPRNYSKQKGNPPREKMRTDKGKKVENSCWENKMKLDTSLKKRTQSVGQTARSTGKRTAQINKRKRRCSDSWRKKGRKTRKKGGKGSSKRRVGGLVESRKKWQLVTPPSGYKKEVH